MDRPSVRGVLAGIILLLAATVVLGWMTRVPVMVQILPGSQEMTFGTALCLLLMGAALLLDDLAPRQAQSGQSLVGAFVFIFAAGMLSENLGDFDLGIDLPTLHAWLVTSNPHPGRMAPNTALALVLGGATLVLMHRVRGALGISLLGILSFGVIIIGLTGLMVHALRIEFIYRWYGYGNMAVHTAVGVNLLGIALQLSCRSLPWYHARVAEKPDGYIAAVGAAWLTVVALVAGISGFMALWERAQDSLGDTLTVAVRHRAQLFQSLIERSIANTGFVVSRPNLSGRIRVLTDTPNDPQARAMLGAMAESFVSSGFSAVAFYDRNGVDLARSGRFVEDAELSAPLKSLYDTQLLWKEDFIVRVRAPVNDGTEMVGMVMTEQHLPILTRTMMDVTELGETGDGGLCASRGEWLDCFPQRLRRHVVSIPYLQNGTPRPITRTFSGEVITSHTIDYRGERVIAAYAPVGTLGLGMSLKVDAAELYAPVYKRFVIFVPLLFALIATGALVLRFQIKPLVAELLRSREALRDEIAARAQIEEDLRYSNINLRQAMLAKDRFLASMSHELRTPLNAIIGFTGTLLMKLPGPLNTGQEKQLQTVQSSARHLLALINDLLDLAKIEAGKLELHLEPIAIRDVLEEVTATLRPQAEAKALSFEAALPPSDLIVPTDRRALSQIVLNITNNAIKFTERGGVRLSARQFTADGRSRVDISVEDTGPGIRAEDQARLFQAFAQVDSDIARRNEGTGLGLHLSQKLSELLGGKIAFRSEYGKGSTFTLELPQR